MIKSILIAGIIAIAMIASAPAFAGVHMGGGGGGHHMGGGGGHHMGGHHHHGGGGGGYDGGYDNDNDDNGYVNPNCVWLPIVGYSTCPYNN